jgi:hypothetical protein
MSLKTSYDIGRQIKACRRRVHLGGRAVELRRGAHGATIDRQALGGSTTAAVRSSAAASSGPPCRTVTLAMSFQHSSDGTSWDNYSTATNASKAIGSTGATGAQAVEDVVEQPVSLVGARRYVRQVLTPTFSGGTSGDILYDQGSVVFGGVRRAAQLVVTCGGRW